MILVQDRPDNRINSAYRELSARVEELGLPSRDIGKYYGDIDLNIAIATHWPCETARHVAEFNAIQSMVLDIASTHGLAPVLTGGVPTCGGTIERLAGFREFEYK